MTHGGFDSLLEQILGTALSDTVYPTIPDTETHIDGKHWPPTVHGQVIFRIALDTESRANLEPNVHHKPTLSDAIRN